MIEGARQLPTHHLTIRVPWHDNGWRGTFCNNPCGNASCTVLERIARARDDAYETQMAGQSLQNLAEADLPPCLAERGTFMSPFPISVMKQHPYVESSPGTHDHFAPTPFTFQPYTAAAVPFRWMLRAQVEGDERDGTIGKAEQLQLDFRPEREPELPWETVWVQEGTNQRILLDTFFSAAKPEESLVFFYAKRTPLADDPRRVIVGVGRVNTVGPSTEYQYVNGKRPSGRIGSYLWEHNIGHSIRSDCKDGFVLPYQRLLEAAEADERIDLPACVAFAPNEFFSEYSYASELLPHDGAIASLLAVERAIQAMRAVLDDEPWDAYLAWIDRELNRLWRVRGAFPGLGAALGAFGLPHGNLLAWHLIGDGDLAVDPWPHLTEALERPEKLPEYLRAGIGATWRKKWRNLPAERRQLLELLARMNLSNEQALRWYQPTERSSAKIELSDGEILRNPYVVYEYDRHQFDAIAFETVDRGLFPPPAVRKAFPLAQPSCVSEAIDPRRVSAAMMQTLQEAALQGHTLLPADWLIQRVRNRPMKPECPLDADTISMLGDSRGGAIEPIALEDGALAYQLADYAEASRLIRRTVEKRRSGKRSVVLHEGKRPVWRALVDQAISGAPGGALSAADKSAREEKAAALQEICEARISVLIGGAGTGKSTLLKALCSIDSIRSGGILLLAPTGKARVRMEETSGMPGQGQTLAQFLLKYQRYDGESGRYFINQNAPRCQEYKTIAVDECSMLTEAQLAALLDAVRGVDRLVLVGDPQQLPPIGAGRPYVDIVQHLRPEQVEVQFPRVAESYAELTVTMRQTGASDERPDLQLANMFAGRPLSPFDDGLWEQLDGEGHKHVKLVRWEQPQELLELLIAEITSELTLDSVDDEIGFARSLGATIHEARNGQRYAYFNAAWGERERSAPIERWQILTPTRQGLTGVLALNRAIQQRYRKQTLELAARSGWNRKIPAPAGPEGIIYGDKVINVVNSGRRKTYPEKPDHYVANGDLGVVVGPFRSGPRKKTPLSVLEVELASQPGFAYKYWTNELNNQEGTPPLELAYTLTIHKTQGSEFGTTFVVIPNPCRILSRELLYTALTRHQGRVIVLHQGDFRELMRLTGDAESEIARRMTNLFTPSRPVEISVRNTSRFLDDHLIYRTERGELVRSKSELIIADKLSRAGVDYRYEQRFDLPGGGARYPDFTIVDDDSGGIWYWEHNGMMGNPEYEKRWQSKLSEYRDAGVLPLTEGGGDNGTLVVTEERLGVGLDVEQVDAYIREITG